MAQIKKEFTKDYLINTLDLPDEAIENNIIGNGRWSIDHEIIFKDNNSGKFYKGYYSQGATEMQDESPWEYEDSITCYEVEKKEIKVMQWVVKEA